jgi:DNA end-binding protein Ku
MARAIWKGHISFGLVEIPVSLMKAEDPHEFDFTLVDRRDHARIGYERVNKNTGKPVAWEDIVRAHEQGGEMVLVSDDELKAANVEATRTIDIMDFVDGADIHPAYFERPYFLEPTRKQGAKAYTLLREALERSGKVGIATIVIRTRQHLAALTTMGHGLVLVLLRFDDELRSVDDLDVPSTADKAGLKPKEIEMAEQLIDSMTSDWDPERYDDTFFEDVKKMLARKRKSGETEPLEVDLEEEKPKRGGVVDLMPLLQKSMSERPKRAGKKVARGRAKTKTKTRAKKKAGRKVGTGRAARSRKSA